MIAFYKNSDIQKWFEAKNMSKSNSTQNDYLITGAGQAMPETRYTKEYLDKAVADARREVILKVENKLKGKSEYFKTGSDGFHFRRIKAVRWEVVDDVLATLRKEELNGTNN